MARTGLEAAPADVEVTTRDERVVWRGLPRTSRMIASTPPTITEHVPLCTSREDVRAMLEGFVAGRSTGQPVVLAEAGDFASRRSASGAAPAVPAAPWTHVPWWANRAHPGLPRPGLSTRRPEPMIAQTRRAPSVRRQQDAPF